MAHILQLQYDTSKFQPLYDSIIDGNRKDVFIDEYFDKETIEDRPKLINLNSEINNLIQETKKLMEHNDFKINEDQFYVEFHKYNIQGKYKSVFDWHEDDKGAVNYNVCTCIYYLHKDETIIGGDLQFTEIDVNIKPNLAVLFNGYETHRISPMDGYGQRKSIVVMFERI